MPGFNLKDAATQSAAEDQGTVVPLKDVHGLPMFYGPEDALKPVTVTVAGTYSERFRKAERAFIEGMGRSRDVSGLSASLDRRGEILAAGCVVAWDGIFEDATETTPIPATAENAATIFRSARWVFEQVWAAMNDHARFFPKPSTP